MSDDIFDFPSTSKFCQNTDKVWSKGDHCLVKWADDGQFYSGRIKQIRRCQKTNKSFAVIRFDDFGPQDDEEIDVSKLFETKNTVCPSKQKKGKVSSKSSGLFSPLTGEEEKSRIENKYGMLFDDDEDSSGYSDLQEKITPKPTTRRKACVVTGGDVKPKPSKTPNTRQAKRRSSEDLLVDKVTEEIQKHRNNLTVELNQEEDEGFTEDDLQKPNFAFKAPAGKVPYILCVAQDGRPAVQVPPTINQYLRDYQRDGIRFLYNHYQLGKGAILGDDMGLGKTVQVIGFLAALLNKQGNRLDILKHKPTFIKKMSDTNYKDEERLTRPFLIIGPGSVLYNWLDELDTWGYFLTRKYHGCDKEACLVEVRKGKVEVVVTSFETFRDNMDEVCSINWEAVIVDEVHRIKDLKSQTTKALRKIPTLLRYGLTGTALQNNMSELWSILDWAQPGILGSSYEFKEEFVKPIEKGQRTDANKRELAEARKKKEKFSEIRKMMMIRRMKTLISDQLPDKDDNVVFCKLSHLQTTVYKAILTHPDLELVLKMDDPCTCGSEKSRGSCCYTEASDGMSVKGLKFSFMHLLMKAANHVALLIPRDTTTDAQRKRATEICDMALKDHQEFVNLTKEATFRTLSDPKYCGKMKILQGLLQVFEKTHSKVLIFSLSTKILDILEQYLISSCYEFRRLDGSVSNKRRMELVREFNKNPNIFIFLISTKAGGLGLNLTGANRVVIFDPNWNPSHDLQAQDRAYRIGQRQNVHVYRLISAGTIEENVYLRQVYKQQLDNVAVCSENAKRLFHGVQGNKHRKGELFGIKNMFSLRTGDSCLTMDILERNAKVEAGLKGFDMAAYVPSNYEISASREDDAGDENLGNHSNTGESSTDSEDFTDLFQSEVEADKIGQISTTSKTDTKSKSGPGKLPKCLNRENLSEAGPSTSKIQINSRSKEQQGSSKRAFRPGSSKAYDKRTKIIRPRLKKGGSKTDEACLQSFSSVGDVLGQNGVLHVHENIKVIGTSRAEDYMSRCAVQEVYELHQNSQVPAVQCDPLSESSSDEEIIQKKRTGRRTPAKKEDDHNTPRILRHDSTRILIGQTPTAIRLKEFEKMAKFKDEVDLLSLAEEIVKGSRRDRLDLLTSFYSQQYPDVGEIIRKNLTICLVDSSVESPLVNTKEKLLKVASNRKKTTPRKMKGVAFLDQSLSDSESQSSPVPKDVSCTNEDSSLEVGLKPSPFAKRRLQQSRAGTLRSCRRTLNRTVDINQPSSSARFNQSTAVLDHQGNNTVTADLQETTNIINPTWMTSDGILYDNMEVIPPKNETKHSKKIKNEKNQISNKTDCVDDLIQEMALDVKPEKVDADLLMKEKLKSQFKQEDQYKQKPSNLSCNRNSGGNYKSVLDDFFSNERISPKKSPTKKAVMAASDNNYLKRKSRATDDLFSEFDNVTTSCSESTTGADDASDILNHSTLNDDSVDCFTDPRKWKKRSKVKLSVSKNVEKLLQESEEDYKNLFKTGKLRRKLPSQTSEKFSPDSEAFQTPSLFS